MKRLLLFLSLLVLGHISLAQETIELTAYHPGGIVERYYTLKTDRKVKQGRYQLFTRKNTAIASGTYSDNKRVGLWHFYDKNGKVTEAYNYTTKQLLFEAPSDSNHVYIDYHFDEKIIPTDTVSIPVRVGGRYYGYLPYVKLFKIDGNNFYGSAPIRAVMKILVSPIGQLAECKLEVQLKMNDSVLDTYLLKNELLEPEDRLFVPATFNGKPVTSTISVYLQINSDWTVSLYD